jgi:hypothetical protein
MVMQEQARRLSQPLPWGRAQKIVVAVLAALVLAGAGVVLAFALSSGAPARADCIDFTFPSTLGAGEVKRCGEGARQICLSGAYRGVEKEVQATCAKAGFGYRAPQG